MRSLSTRSHRCRRIVLFLHSEGGDAYAGLSGMNHIQACRVPVHCVADGFVASAATFLLLAGRRRSGMEHSVVLIHQLSTGFWGKFTDLKDECANSEQLMQMLRDLYTSRTRLSRKKIDRILSKELTMTIPQCIECGIVDGFYGRRGPAPVAAAAP